MRLPTSHGAEHAWRRFRKAWKPKGRLHYREVWVPPTSHEVTAREGAAGQRRRSGTSPAPRSHVTGTLGAPLTGFSKGEGW